MSFQDKSLKCLDCGQQFTFTAGEQEFYASRDLKNEPKRCNACRQAKKTRNGSSDYSRTSRY